jgi:hypothetical protein
MIISLYFNKLHAPALPPLDFFSNSGDNYYQTPTM